MTHREDLLTSATILEFSDYLRPADTERCGLFSPHASARSPGYSPKVRTPSGLPNTSPGPSTPAAVTLTTTWSNGNANSARPFSSGLDVEGWAGSRVSIAL